MLHLGGFAKPVATLSASFANIGPGNSPQTNADVTVTFAGGGTRKLRATLLSGVYGAGGKGFQVFVNGVSVASVTPADAVVLSADISSGNIVHFQATKGGTGGTTWNATVELNLDGQPLGTFSANVTAP